MNGKLLVGIILILAIFICGCSAPSQLPRNNPTATPTELTPGPTPTSTAVTASPTLTTPQTSEEPTINATENITPNPQITMKTGDSIIFDKKDAVYWNTFKAYNFEDFKKEGLDLTYQNPGDTFRITIKSEKPLMVYVIPTMDVWTLDNYVKIQWDNVNKKFVYQGIVPLVKMEQVYDDSKEFTVEKTGKYSVIVDGRLTETDYTKSMNEAFKYEINISKIN